MRAFSRESGERTHSCRITSHQRRSSALKPLFLTYLKPASVDPNDLVDREADEGWLRAGLDSYLSVADPDYGRAFCIHGEKGVGKSILTRKVLGDLRELHAATTLFLTVDCRRFRDQRGVYRELARQAVNQLGSMRSLNPRVDEALISTARVFETIASFDSAQRSEIHEQLVQHKAALNLKGERKLLGLLELSYDISVGRSSKTAKTLTGSVQIDDGRLREMVIDFFADVRAHAGVDVVLYLDNIDELDHDALLESDTQLLRVRAETDALLGLSQAPIGLVLNMRTYCASILTREIVDVRVLGRMSAADHVAMLDRRLERESEASRGLLSAEHVRATINHLGELARTPLAFLIWFKFLCEQGDAWETPLDHLTRVLAIRFPTVNRDTLTRVATRFGQPDVPLPRADILAVCDGNEAVFRQLLHTQVVLPRDFWAPNEFTLDPELDFLLGPRA